MIVIAVFILALALGIPICWMLGMCGVTFLADINATLLQVLPQKMMSSAATYSLLCIPLFILAGELMALSGDVDRLWKLGKCLVGHIKGAIDYIASGKVEVDSMITAEYKLEDYFTALDRVANDRKVLKILIRP